MMRVEQCGPLDAAMRLPVEARPQIVSAQHFALIFEGKEEVALISLEETEGRFYVCFQPFKELSLGQLRELRRLWPDFPAIARVLDERAKRFAEFFGFRELSPGVMMK